MLLRTNGKLNFQFYFLNDCYRICLFDDFLKFSEAFIYKASTYGVQK